MLRNGTADYGPLEIQQLISEYTKAHRHYKRFRGGLHDVYVAELFKLVSTHRLASILDYGSGKGRQYTWSDGATTALRQHEDWGVTPVCYDPGVPELAIKPSCVFDAVICTDVAEHIPESCMDWFLTDVLSYATKFAFMGIGCDPSGKSLPSGTPAHLTVKEPSWWCNVISDALHVLGYGSFEESNFVGQLEGHRWVSKRFELLVLFVRNPRLKR